ncbi:MAG TPA: DUF3047 domain-containing protein [Methylomirabilota bacterium]|jgi:hypothetical protein
MWRISAFLLVLLLAVATGWAADQVVIEDWKAYPNGTKGIPPGWQRQSWGNPAYDFRIVDNDGQRALHLKSRNEGSTITKEVTGITLKDTPILEWRWKVVALPNGGHSCKKATDDQAVQVYVTWPRFPSAVRSRIIGYVWDTTAPVGTVCKSENTGTVTYIVLRSGPADLGKWLTEQRDLRADFKKIYGEEPDAPGGISVASDSNDTRSEAEAFVGPILLRKP